MILRTENAISLAAVALLAACGGTTVSAPLSLTPAGFSEGATPIAYDPASSALTVNGVAVNTPRNTNVLTNGDAAKFTSLAPTHHSAIAQNGDVYAIGTLTTGAAGVRAVAYGRRGNTEFPTTGTATFSGDYVGMFGRDVSEGNQTLFALVDGDVALSVDMENMSLTGDITNRMAYDSSGVLAAAPVAFADVQIAGGTIGADGSFDATATGGERTFGGGTYTYVSGQVNGVFGGTDGNAAAGVVQIRETNPVSSTLHQELGSFVATRD